MKPRENEILRVYKDYWITYFSRGKGIKEKVFSNFHPDAKGIGTGKDEIVNSAVALRKFIDREFEEVTETLPVKFIWSDVSVYDSMAVGNGEIEIIVNPEKNLKMRVRNSLVFKKHSGNWKVLHLHVSLPAAGQAEDESFPLNALKVEKEKLEKEVANKTADLRKKNRELEIESALERIRAQTMAMHRSDELRQVVATVYEQFQDLGFDSWGCALVTRDETSQGWNMWLSITEQAVLPEPYLVPDTDDPVQRRFFEAWQEDIPYQVIEFDGIEKQNLDQRLFYETDWKYFPEIVKEHMQAQNHTACSMAVRRNSILEAMGPVPLPDNKAVILQRFATVFEQAYTRFLDLQKAEAQAREAQIEAALERVRSRSLAMHKSEELVEVATILYKELRLLDVREFSDVSIVIVDETNNQLIVWGARTNPDFLEKAVLPLLGDQILQRLYDAWHQQEAFFTLKVEGIELRNHNNFVFPKASRTELEDNAIKGMPDPTFFHCAFFSMGYLELVADKELSEDSSFVLTRFAMVFEQTYTRFLDLQKAEEQAREAQVEAAIEKIRSRSLAMHKSDELQEVINTVYNRLMALGIKMDSVNFDIFKGTGRDFDGWIAAPNGKYSTSIYFPAIEYGPSKAILDARERGDDFVAYQCKGNEKKRWFDFAFEHTDLRKIPNDRKQQIRKSEYWTTSIALGKYSAMQLNSYSQKLFSERENDILKRFARVFEQAYTRFLDLQKAEAQAREAKIEAALERVRSRSMAMHNSEELVEVATVLYMELRLLDVREFSQASIVVNDEPNNELIVWGARTESDYLEKAVFPLLGDQILQKFYDAWRQQEDFFTLKVEGAALRKHINFVFPKASRTEMEELAIKGMPDPMFFHCAFFSMGYLELVADKELSEDSSFVLTRFAKVFEQTYTRFLDLKKAEEQAREAQIETALEKVRSRSLAMHRSDELQEVIMEVFTQLENLGINPKACAIDILKGASKDWNIWVGNSGNDYPELVLVPYIDNPVLNDYNKARKKRKTLFVESHTKEVKDAFFRHAFKKSGLKVAPKERQKMIMAAAGFTRSTSFTKHIGIMMINYDHITFTDEENDILIRLTKVFDQSYTRFLDLQKAEAQAREAQIEAALERVRSKAMAMHNSTDLSSAACVVFTELRNLGINPIRCGVGLLKESRKAQLYSATSSPDGDSLALIGSVVLSGHPILENIYDFWLNNEEYFPVLSGEQLKSYYELLLKGLPVKVPALQAGRKEYGHFLPFSVGDLYAWSETPYDDAELKILRRFAAIIDLTFRRYIELQKAEAQARESQIEAALERVRAAGMAMHSSKDLAEASTILFEQLVDLGVDARRVGFALPDDEKQEFTIWSTFRDDHGKAKLLSAFLYYDQHPFYPKMIENWQAGKKLFSYELHGRDLQNYYKSWNRTFETPKALLKTLKENTSEYYQFAYFDQGMIYAFTAQSLSEGQHQLLLRFANAFELTYTRFLDLQKAEAQTREAQIEAALERVRSKAMAMHNSTDLPVTASVVFDELGKLGITTLRSGISIQNRENRKILLYTGTNLKDGDKLSLVGSAILDNHPVLSEIYDRWIRGEDYFPVLKGELLKSYYEQIAPTFTVPKEQTEVEQYGYFISYSHGIFYGWAKQPFTEEQKKILKRFASVVDLTFKRYFDLKKAEEQAREGQIEAALERVRSKAMSMQKSDDLSLAVKTIFEELDKLDLGMLRCGIAIINKEKRNAELWTTTVTKGKNTIQVSGDQSLDIHPLLQGAFEAWKNRTDFSYTLEGEDLNRYYKALLGVNYKLPKTQSKVSNTEGLNQYYYVASFQAGSLFAFRATEFPEESKVIIKRFADVFNLTYTRFQDLQHAEGQAQEAQVEVALERVRSRTMAMHQSDELAETAAVVFKQLMNLGIEPNRIYLGIIKDQKGIAEFWITDEDGSKVSKGFTANLNDNSSFKKIYAGWKEQKKSITIDMKGKKLQAYLKHLTSLGVPFKGGLSQKRRMQYIAYFSQGFIGVASPDETKPETLQLLERFAAVYNLTNIRFNDLKQAEAQNKIIQAENERKTQELEEARALQLAMLPKYLPQLPNLEIAVYMKTATEVGGDYYDYCFNDDGSLNICLGDATGHGMKAGIMVSSMKSIFTTNAPKMDIENFVATANSGVKSMNLKRMMMGFVMININKNVIKMINAGMPPVFLYRKNVRAVDEIIANGLPIGAMNHSIYVVSDISLDKDDVIILMSDGMPELQNENNEMYGYRRVRESFQKVAKNKPKEIISYLKEEGSAWVKDKDPEDDVTFVVIKVR